jgi:hypothetical protein
MSFKAVDRAMAAALLGIDPASYQPTESDGLGVRAPVADAQKQQGTKLLGTRKVNFGGTVPRDIPVYRFSSRGRRAVEQWPAFSYELIGCQFNPQRYIWSADRFVEPVVSSFVDVRFPSGRTVQGPSLLKVRDHAEPFDLMFDVRLWVKDVYEQLVLMETILTQMPARGCLNGVLANGVRKSWELRQSTINNVDDQEPTLENVQVRGFSWVITYVVETHLDNSEAYELIRTVTAPVELDQEVFKAQQLPRPRLTDLVVSPAIAAFAKGQLVSFTATATYANGVSEDITKLAQWESSDTAFLQPMSEPGTFLGGQSDAETELVTVTANFGGLSGKTIARGIDARGV